MSQWKWGTYLMVSHLNTFADWGLISAKGTTGHFFVMGIGIRHNTSDRNCHRRSPAKPLYLEIYSSSYFSERMGTFTLDSQGNICKNQEIRKDFCRIMCFHNNKFVHKRGLPKKKKSDSRKMASRAEQKVSWQPCEPNTAPKKMCLPAEPAVASAKEFSHKSRHGCWKNTFQVLHTTAKSTPWL